MQPENRTTFLFAAALVLALAVAACAGSGDESLSNRDPGGQGSGTDLPAGPIFDGGATTPSCEDSCPDEEQRMCSGLGYVICADHNDDGCLEWGAVQSCAAGTACVGGKCEAACANQPCTAMGAKKCSEAGEVVSCGDFDGDGCLEWGPGTPCAEGLVCTQGFCKVSCADDCTALGAKQCEGNSVVHCADGNLDGCLEWGQPIDCGSLSCVQGHCKAECNDECTAVDAKKCSGPAVQTCGDYDTDDCLEWGTAVPCAQDEVCSGGVCSTVCQSTCTVVGAKHCALDAVETCDDYNDDGCLEWGTAVPCDEGLTCVPGGHCAATCQNQCTVKGARQCDEALNVITCDDYNDDGCLEWGTPEQCEGSSTCVNGTCEIQCEHACPVRGQRRCVPATTDQHQECTDVNGDGCLEWGTAETCDQGLVCAEGTCAMTCTSTCDVDGDKACEGDAVVICGDYNSDGCLEHGTASPCGGHERCEAGSCVPADPPAGVLISELLYDSEGSPDTEAFVEISGPAGTSLKGFVLAAVNGRDGGDYDTVPLSGAVGGDGFFVVAHPDASWDEEELDLRNKDVDLQNGPDSLQLRFGAHLVDAVGYGVFGEGQHFAGEGEAAPDAGPGNSLARTAGAADTGNNLIDFAETATPTPGAANIITTPNRPPVASLSCPPGGEPYEELIFDASASSDPDGPIEEYTFNFGDGTSEQSGGSAQQVHAYAGEGSFTVTLTVTDEQGLFSSTTCNVFIERSTVVDDTGGNTDPGGVDDPGGADDPGGSTDPGSSTDPGGSTDPGAYHDAGPVTASVAGDISTTTWSGTVLVMGDARIPEGNTLTVAAGTNVLFLFADQGDGTGANGLEVAGALKVEGAPGSPVFFTVQQAQHRKPRAWTGIEVKNSSVGTVFKHAVIEYADIGIKIASSATVTAESTTIRRCRLGADIGSAGKLNLLGSTVADNTGHGVYVRYDAATLSATNSVISGNGEHGIKAMVRETSVNLFGVHVLNNGETGVHLQGTTFAAVSSVFSGNAEAAVHAEDGKYFSDVHQTNVTIEHCNVEGNGRGLNIVGKVLGSVSFSNLRSNRFEGARLMPKTGDRGAVYVPNVSFNNNNLHGNSTEKGPLLERPGLSLKTDSQGTGTETSSPWTTSSPDPVEGIVVEVNTVSAYSIKARIYKDSTDSGQLIFNKESRWGPGYADVRAHEVRTMVLQAYESTIGGYVELILHAALSYQAGVNIELLVTHGTETIDAKGNWWGTADDPTSVIAAGVAEAVDSSEHKTAPVATAGP